MRTNLHQIIKSLIEYNEICMCQVRADEYSVREFYRGIIMGYKTVLRYLEEGDKND